MFLRIVQGLFRGFIWGMVLGLILGLVRGMVKDMILVIDSENGLGNGYGLLQRLVWEIFQVHTFINK